MRLAHFSDIHVTYWPLAAGLAPKRFVALGSYYLADRRSHFRDAKEQLAALLADIDAQSVDHALCTGDLTGVSGAREFQAAAEAFGERARDAEHFTCIPGNHDRYLESVEGEFERYFGDLCFGGDFPFVKPLTGGVTIVAVDAARPTGLLDASGRVGDGQLEILKGALAHPELKGRFVVLALHYGLLRANGTRELPSHGLRDDVKLISAVDDSPASVDLIVHGHLHRPFVTRTKRRWIVNAGSATDLHVPCGYFIYDIDAAEHAVTLHRRVWDAKTRRYVDDTSGTFARRLWTRNGIDASARA